MLETRNNKIVVFLGLLVTAIVFSLFFGRQATLEYEMQDAMESHDHEKALMIASKVLEEKPGHQEAINVIKESGQILLYLRLAQSKLPDFGVVENKKVEPEKVFEAFNTARAFAIKAKGLDSKFKTTLKFEEKLDKAQIYVLNILATNTFEVGKSIYSSVLKDYEEKAAIISSASNSGYLNIFLNVQSAWAPMHKPAEEIKHNINTLLDKMDDTGQLVSAYKAGKAEHLTELVLTYIQVVKKSVDTILTPKGSYKDFMKVAQDSTDEYKNAQRKLKRALPGPTDVSIFSVLVKDVADYKLFQNELTVDLIKGNQYLQGT